MKPTETKHIKSRAIVIGIFFSLFLRQLSLKPFIFKFSTARASLEKLQTNMKVPPNQPENAELSMILALPKWPSVSM